MDWRTVMPTCNKCDVEVDEEDIYCRKCGIKLIDDSNLKEKQRPIKRRYKHHSPKRNIVILIIAIIIVIGAISIGFNWMNIFRVEKEKLIGGRALTFETSNLKLDFYLKTLSNFNMNIPFSEPDLKTIFDKKMLKGYKLDLGYHAIGGGVLSNINDVLSKLNDHVDILESYVGFIRDDGFDFPFLSKLDKIKIFPNKFLNCSFISTIHIRPFLNPFHKSINRF